MRSPASSRARSLAPWQRRHVMIARGRTATATLWFVMAATLPACNADKGASPAATTEHPANYSSSADAATEDTPAFESALPEAVDISDAGAKKFRLGGGTPDWLTADGDNVWVAGTRVGQGVARLNGEGRLDRSVAVGSVCAAMDVGYGSLRVPSCDNQKVLRVDLGTGRVIASVAVPGEGMFEESSVAAGENGVWVLSGTTHPRLVRIDPATNRVANAWPLPDGVAAVRAGLGAVWVTVRNGQLLKVDPRHGRVVARTKLGLGPQFLAVGAGSVWVMNQVDGTVSRVNPLDSTVTATVQVADFPITGGDIAAADDAVWVRTTDSLAIEIDPATNQVVTRLGPSVESGSVAIGSSQVWFSVEIFKTVYRLPRDAK